MACCNLSSVLCQLHHLLTKKETYFLVTLAEHDKAIAWQTCVLWALRAAQQAAEQGLIPNDSIHDRLVGTIIGLRESLQSIYGTAAQPVPFMYYHLLSTLNWCFQPAAAYHLVATLSLSHYESILTKISCGLLGLFCTFLAGLGLLGLRALGKAMSDPFGVFPFFFHV